MTLLMAFYWIVVGFLGNKASSVAIALLIPTIKYLHIVARKESILIFVYASKTEIATYT